MSGVLKAISNIKKINLYHVNKILLTGEDYQGTARVPRCVKGAF